MMNVQLVQSIKRHLAEQTSAELRKMLEVRDVSLYSDEAFAAAQELLDDRARGGVREPSPRPPPPPPPTPAQREAAADALLRRQVRLVGAYYYFVAVVWLLLLPPLTRLSGGEPLITAAAAIPGVFFWLVGRGLRRFTPTARGIGILFSILNLPAFPFGTIIGLYCIDKLTRADHLFGGGRHPGERSSA